MPPRLDGYRKNAEILTIGKSRVRKMQLMRAVFVCLGFPMCGQRPWKGTNLVTGIERCSTQCQGACLALQGFGNVLQPEAW